MKHPNARPEILFLRRDSPSTESDASLINNKPRNTREAHVAFPGGRTEEGDEGGLYTGGFSFLKIKCVSHILFYSSSDETNMGRNRSRPRRTRFYVYRPTGRQRNNHFARKTTPYDSLSFCFSPAHPTLPPNRPSTLHDATMDPARVARVPLSEMVKCDCGRCIPTGSKTLDGTQAARTTSRRKHGIPCYPPGPAAFFNPTASNSRHPRKRIFTTSRCHGFCANPNTEIMGPLARHDA